MDLEEIKNESAVFQRLLLLFNFLFARAEQAHWKISPLPTSSVVFLLSAYLCASSIGFFWVSVSVSFYLSYIFNTSVLCPSVQQHQSAPRSWRRTVCSSTSCPIWAARGSKLPGMRARRREPWPPCALRVPSQSPSRCTSPVGRRAPSGQDVKQHV